MFFLFFFILKPEVWGMEEINPIIVTTKNSKFLKKPVNCKVHGVFYFPYKTQCRVSLLPKKSIDEPLKLVKQRLPYAFALQNRRLLLERLYYFLSCRCPL